MLKSDFQKLLPEDCKQYRELSDRFMELQPTDGANAYDIMKQSWALGQRWSEIQASARKVEGLSTQSEGVTAFKKWCYERYRQCQLMHECSRMIWRIATEEETWLRRQGLSRKDTK